MFLHELPPVQLGKQHPDDMHLATFERKRTTYLQVLDQGN
jgi:hypothetical protein